MLRKLLPLFFILFILPALGRIDSTKKQVASVFNLYANGDYEKALNTLEKMQIGLQTHQKSKKDIQGFIYYWQGLCQIKLTYYSDALKSLKRAINENFEADDIYYEYGQALYTSEKLKKAREAFKLSVKNKYKRGVSLYYIAFISQELGDLKTAVKFYEAIEKLPEDEKKEIVQPARMQVGDIYFEQVKRRKDSLRAIEKYVIPQYKKALKWDKDSQLAGEIERKIETIQKRYDLVLFYLRNGRPTARPPYFVKHNYTYSIDDNVNTQSADTLKSLSAEEYSAASSQYNFFGRYSFYPNSSISLVPQLSLGYTQYHSDQDDIKANNNFFITATLQTTYEHYYKKNPATFFIDLDYTYNMDDADIDDNLEKSSDGIGVTFSEQLQFWQNNPSIFRFGYATTEALEEVNNFTTTTFTFEQLMLVKSNIFYLTSSYAQNSFAQEPTQDNSALTFRLDFIMANSFQQISPNIYYSMTNTTYEDDTEDESLSTYGINLSRSFGRHWFLFLDYSQAINTSADESLEYEQSIIRFSLDYIY